MKRLAGITFLLIAPATGFFLATSGSGAPPVGESNSTKPSEDAAATEASATSVDEARVRARLLHEAFHATLHIVHLRYYREDEGLPLPAATLKSVFREMDRSHNVQLRWLAVNATPMNVDHKPKTEFERKAVAALASGDDEFELTENGVYRHAGPITLSGECLKCHVPDRKNLDARAAGLVISMPVSEN